MTNNKNKDLMTLQDSFHGEKSDTDQVEDKKQYTTAK